VFIIPFVIFSITSDTSIILGYWLASDQWSLWVPLATRSW